MASKLRKNLEAFFCWMYADDASYIEEEEGGKHLVQQFMEDKELLEPPANSPQEAKRLTQELRAIGCIHSCITCEHFNHTYEMCELAKQKPPAEVIANGCPSWAFEEIPF